MREPASPGPRTAVYPGSFDPITLGHLEIVQRGLQLFDRVIVAVGVHPSKPGFFPIAERCALIAASIAHLPRAQVRQFSGLVIDFCREQHATVLLRGLRTSADFEHENQMALANRDMAPTIETVFLIPQPQQQFVSSSLVREIASHGGDFGRYVPTPVATALRARLVHS